MRTGTIKQSDNPDGWPDPTQGEGYYWIKVKDFLVASDAPIEFWTVGYWRSEEFWETIGTSDQLDWDSLVEIGSRLLPPSEVYDVADVA